MKTAPLVETAGDGNSRSSWEDIDVDSALARLKSDSDTGLSRLEAAHRLASCGRNTIEEKAISPVTLFARKFWNPAAWMLEAILILSAVLGKKADVWGDTGVASPERRDQHKSGIARSLGGGGSQAETASDDENLERSRMESGSGPPNLCLVILFA